MPVPVKDGQLRNAHYAAAEQPRKRTRGDRFKREPSERIAENIHEKENDPTRRKQQREQKTAPLQQERVRTLLPRLPELPFLPLLCKNRGDLVRQLRLRRRGIARQLRLYRGDLIRQLRLRRGIANRSLRRGALRRHAARKLLPAARAEFCARRILLTACGAAGPLCRLCPAQRAALPVILCSAL